MRCQLARHDMGLGLGCVGVECLRADDIELREMRRHRRQRRRQESRRGIAIHVAQLYAHFTPQPWQHHRVLERVMDTRL